MDDSSTQFQFDVRFGHSRQCVGSTKTSFCVLTFTHPSSVRRQGKTREYTFSCSITLSCRSRSNGAVEIGCQSRNVAASLS
jgi:hypothetical protein